MLEKFVVLESLVSKKVCGFEKFGCQKSLWFWKVVCQKNYCFFVEDLIVMRKREEKNLFLGVIFR